mmetsp:Transcript_46678/g.111001  ORF Transcript_46678/g.111001 Transcript_46678/m.111001 type:complete len:484 (-) Transcript_46678:98-1549(-)
MIDVAGGDAESGAVAKEETCDRCSKAPDFAGGILQVASLTVNGNLRLCLRCAFCVMDPFRPARGEDVLFLSPLPATSLQFTLDLPELRRWRKEGSEFEVRTLRRGGAAVSSKAALHQVWPRYIDVEVNEKQALTVKPVRGKKRRDVPYTMSALLRNGSNSVEARIEDENPGQFVLAVMRTQPLLPKDVARRVVRTPFDECQRRICSILRGHETEGGDTVEAVGNETVDLRCPITLVRPTSPPARGAQCLHLRCFDLEAYLIANYKTRAFNSRWRCPICSYELRPNTLRIDAYIEEMLSNTHATVEEVVLHADGSYAPFRHGAPEPPPPDIPQPEGEVQPSTCVIEEGPEDANPMDGNQAGSHSLGQPVKKARKLKRLSSPGPNGSTSWQLPVSLARPPSQSLPSGVRIRSVWKSASGGRLKHPAKDGKGSESRPSNGAGREHPRASLGIGLTRAQWRQSLRKAAVEESARAPFAVDSDEDNAA